MPVTQLLFDVSREQDETRGNTCLSYSCSGEPREQVWIHKNKSTEEECRVETSEGWTNGSCRNGLRRNHMILNYKRVWKATDP